MVGNKLNDEVQYEAKDKKGKGSGTKDACYHKVKSRYSVWPSAYASGALVKCRKVGAANWGNKSEQVEVVGEGAEKSYYIDKEAEKRGMEREARKAQNKAAAKERAAQKRRSERNQLRRQGQYGAQGKYYVTKHMEREAVEYTGPNKKDLKQIKKMDNPDYAKKLADYEKNMDPKKRQALKDKATKGMKFTQEGMSYGLYKGSGKASGAMKDYLDRKAKMLTKKRNKQPDRYKNNPAFDSTSPDSKSKDLARTRAEGVTFQQFQEKCWAGYEKKGMKTMFGKRYPNCVKKKK
jgi:hypothetical protein